uniref:HECT domain-containing protein n=1 Tax=Paramoeba aestuarina TaxID=180227 RepID=A0A7S4K1E7_9EUKA|mmetsp:Transcript_14432/g.22522  ORF Transcript_14432/g.22522 Transcript_14432/m.22522 type:complete len:153 (+) Transcript_14432:3-461(+)
MGWVLPVEMLVMFNHNETRELFCGRAEIDIETLRKHTQYADVSPSAPHITFFWEVLQEMSFVEKTKFLRFTCAMSRLPVSASDWSLPFTIYGPNENMKKNPDESLPLSQTCFFALYLPLYTNKEAMKRGLLTAIECVEMDADQAVLDNAAWA